MNLAHASQEFIHSTPITKINGYIWKTYLTGVFSPDNPVPELQNAFTGLCTSAVGEDRERASLCLHV